MHERGDGFARLTISALNSPTNFKADGDLSERDATGMRPFLLKPSESNKGLGTFTNDKKEVNKCPVFHWHK